MPKSLPVSQRLAAQKEAIIAAQRKSDEIKLKEAKRLVKLFDSAGFYEHDISDEQLRHSLDQLIASVAGSQPAGQNGQSQDSPSPTAVEQN